MKACRRVDHHLADPSHDQTGLPQSPATIETVAAHLTYPPATRRPRFDRGNQPYRAQLTERDLDILEYVAEHRFLRSVDVTRLVDGSDKKIIERLGQLYYAGYLDRPAAQGEYYRAGGGSSPIIYALADDGARVLIDAKRLPPSRTLIWERKNDNVKRPHIHHTLKVADFSIRLISAARARTDLRLQRRTELLQTLPEQTRENRSPFTWTVPIMHRGQTLRIGVNPDHAFAVLYADGFRRCYLLECDRAKMPLERPRDPMFLQTSILRKLIGYETGRQQQLHTKHFNWKNFRVLFVTESPDRTDNIIDLVNRHDQVKHSPLFYVTDTAALDASPDIFTHQWRTTTKPRTLID
jgi:hypothetical protein